MANNLVNGGATRTILSELSQVSDNSDEIVVNQKKFDDDVVMADIKKMDAKTRNTNSVRDSQNRSKIALILTRGFVFIAAIIVIGAPVFNATMGRESQVDVAGLLESFNSVFGTVLGFVLGYYFKVGVKS